MEVTVNNVKVNRVMTSDSIVPIAPSDSASAKELVTIYLVTFLISLFAFKGLWLVARAI